MPAEEKEKSIDTKLRAGSRYFLNRNLVPPQALEIYYSNPTLILRKGTPEALLKEVERIDAGFNYAYLDNRPNLHKDYQQASWAYRVKIEDAISEGFVEVKESDLYPLTIQSVRNTLFERHLIKPFWLPEVSSEIKDNWLHSSHYGGATYFKDQTYPTCRNCQHFLTHLLQINLSELPESFDFSLREGLVKIYYCVDEDGDCELFDPKQDALSPNYMCLYIPPEEIDNIVEYPEIYDCSTSYEHFDPMKITGWKYGGEEFPDEEYLTDVLGSASLEFTETERYAYSFFVAPYHSDKLGGWPQWTTFSEVALCKVCSEPMTMIFHLDPGAYVAFSPAAVVGRVSICPKHKEEVFFTYVYF